MPITTTGSDIALQRNPTTGKFGFLLAADGNPTLTDSAEHAVLSQLVEKLGQWWADTSGTHGSRLYTVLHDRTAAGATNSATQIESYVLEALQLLVDQQKIRGADDRDASKRLTVRATRVGPGRYSFDINYTTPGGRRVNKQLVLGY